MWGGTMGADIQLSTSELRPGSAHHSVSVQKQEPESGISDRGAGTTAAPVRAQQTWVHPNGSFLAGPMGLTTSP